MTTNLICIGRDIEIGGALIKGLYLTPSGDVAIASELTNLDAINLPKELSYELLNNIAEAYYYNMEGQAMTLIDLMARAGYMTFDDECKLESHIRTSLKSEEFICILTENEAPAISERSFVRQYADRAAVDEDDLIDLILELETVTGAETELSPYQLVITANMSGTRYSPYLTFLLLQHSVKLYIDTYILSLNLSENMCNQITSDMNAFVSTVADDGHIYVDVDAVLKHRELFLRLVEKHFKEFCQHN